MAKKYLNEVKEVLDGAEEVSNKIDPKAEAALKEQVKKESKTTKRTGGLRV